jgi:ribosome-associated protein
MPLTVRDKIRLAFQAAEDKKADEPVALNLDGLSAVTDFFVVAGGTSTTQVRAIADGIVEKLAAEGVEPLGTEGYTDGTWVLLDYVDFVVHIFHRDKRVFFALEDLWSDAPRVRPADLAPRKRGGRKRTAETRHAEEEA